jgi:hypothetical protein
MRNKKPKYSKTQKREDRPKGDGLEKLARNCKAIGGSDERN